MKNLLILMAFLITGCGAVNASALAFDTEYRTPQATATISPVPTATIGYQATAHVAETQVARAQATADEANRIMVQATNDQKQRDHETNMQNAQATQQAESNAMVQLGWTATAAQTAIPLTATAQVENSTAIASYTTVTVAQLTATAALPTQIVAVANAETQAQFAPLYMGVQIFAIFAIGVFLLFVSWMLRWYWVREDARAQARSPQGVAERNGFQPIPQVESEPEFIQPMETIVTVKRDLGDGNMRMDRYTVPCTKDMLLQFAENVLTKNWTLGINAWERDGTLFSRDTYKPFRAWLQANKFTASTGGGALALTDAGRVFLDGFLNSSTLPTEYQFGEMAAAQ
jgi:hypothetical protein